MLLSEDEGRRLDDRELRFDKGDLRQENGEWRIFYTTFRWKDYGLRIGNQGLRIPLCNTTI